MLLCLLGAGPAFGGEFGNVVGTPEVEKESRTASATALEGVEFTIAGLRARELRLGSGAAEFERAASRLRDAADQMQSVLNNLHGAPLSPAQLAFLQRRAENVAPDTMVYAMFREAKSVDEVYRGFADATRNLARKLDGAANEENAFSALLPTLVQYFHLADDVATLKTVN